MLTREDAKGKFYFYFREQNYHEMVINQANEVINQIYDSFEAQMKTKDERIKELEEAMKHKTCNTCKKVKSCLFHKVATDPMPTMNEVNAFLICFGCIDHEPKDNA